VLTWRKGPAPDLPAGQFTAVTCTDDRAETALARALDGHYARAGDEAYAVIREALAASGDICPGPGELLIRLDPLTAPRRTAALAALCDQLTAAGICYPGTDLVLRYEVKSRPTPA
jgi:Transposase protein